LLNDYVYSSPFVRSSRADDQANSMWFKQRMRNFRTVPNLPAYKDHSLPVIGTKNDK